MPIATPRPATPATGSTARCATARCSTSSAWTCGPTGAPTPPAASPAARAILGAEQVDWLIREVGRVAGDLEGDRRRHAARPVVPDGPVIEEAVATATPARRSGASSRSPGCCRRSSGAGSATRLADRRRALLRGPPLRPVPRGVHRLRPVLGVRRGPDRRRRRSGRTRSTARSGRRSCSRRSRTSRASRPRAATSSSATPASTRAPECSRSRCATCSARSSGPRTSPRPTTEGPVVLTRLRRLRGMPPTGAGEYDAHTLEVPSG